MSSWKSSNHLNPLHGPIMNNTEAQNSLEDKKTPKVILEPLGFGRVKYTCPKTGDHVVKYHCEDCNVPQWDIYMVTPKIWGLAMDRYRGGSLHVLFGKENWTSLNSGRSYRCTMQSAFQSLVSKRSVPQRKHK